MMVSLETAPIASGQALNQMQAGDRIIPRAPNRPHPDCAAGGWNT